MCLNFSERATELALVATASLLDRINKHKYYADSKNLSENYLNSGKNMQ